MLQSQTAHGLQDVETLMPCSSVDRNQSKDLQLFQIKNLKTINKNDQLFELRTINNSHLLIGHPEAKAVSNLAHALT